MNKPLSGHFNFYHNNPLPQPEIAISAAAAIAPTIMAAADVVVIHVEVAAVLPRECALFEQAAASGHHAPPSESG